MHHNKTNPNKTQTQPHNTEHIKQSQAHESIYTKTKHTTHNTKTKQK